MNIDYNEACVVEYTHWNNLFKIKSLVVDLGEDYPMKLDITLHIDKTPVQVFDEPSWSIVNVVDYGFYRGDFYSEGQEYLLIDEKKFREALGEVLNKLIINEIFN